MSLDAQTTQTMEPTRAPWATRAGIPAQGDPAAGSGGSITTADRPAMDAPWSREQPPDLPMPTSLPKPGSCQGISLTPAPWAKPAAQPAAQHQPAVQDATRSPPEQQAGPLGADGTSRRPPQQPNVACATPSARPVTQDFANLRPAMPTPAAALPGGDGTARRPARVAQPAAGPAERRIHSSAQLAQFLRSDTLKDFVAFILSLNEAAKGRVLSEPVVTSATVSGMLHALDTLSGWVDEIPPVRQALRYGNPAFREWLARVQDRAEDLMRPLVPEQLQRTVPELASYWAGSFGNGMRIDYGTGHETTFAAWLFCVAKLGLLRDDDRPALVLRVFLRYLSLMRRVQTTYWLEPAGSHGVWGLDDYQFLPFLWGSAQLVDHPDLLPSSIRSPVLVKEHAPDFMYLQAVQFVQQVKKGPFAETSPMLNDISGVPSWSKVNSGMIKMYQAEVLSKLPIMQHFLFGSLIPFEPTP